MISSENSTVNSPAISKAHYLYTPLFCEENIWQLLNSLINEKQSIDRLWVVFITNAQKSVAIFNQQAAPDQQVIIWDYHAILLSTIAPCPVFDFDSRLPFGTPLKHYLHHSFLDPQKMPEELTPCFRKIPAQSYWQQFYSDRSHMREKIAPSQFPRWPLINAGLEHPITLDNYLDLDLDIDGSRLLKPTSLEQLEQWLSDR